MKLAIQNQTGKTVFMKTGNSAMGHKKKTEDRRNKYLNVESDTIIVGDVGAGAAVAAGRDASASINSSVLPQAEIEEIVEKLLTEVKAELGGNDLIKYVKATETLKQQLLTQPASNPSLLKKVFGTLSLLDNANGSLELMSKTWPLIQTLLTIAAALPK